MELEPVSPVAAALAQMIHDPARIGELRTPEATTRTRPVDRSTSRKSLILDCGVLEVCGCAKKACPPTTSGAGTEPGISLPSARSAVDSWVSFRVSWFHAHTLHRPVSVAESPCSQTTQGKATDRELTPTGVCSERGSRGEPARREVDDAHSHPAGRFVLPEGQVLVVRQDEE
jgi:hypothetical protein